MLDLKTMAKRYHAARAAFLDNAERAGWKTESILHPLPGPDGGPLHMDLAFCGDPEAQDLLMISSGTHGIEGYLGSQIQSRLLEEGIVGTTRDDLHTVMVHAVNPYGFAWHRRVNEDNVDLNRNFIDFGKPLPVNEGYAGFYDILNPQAWDEGHSARLKQEAAEAIARMGLAAVFQAVSGGQYTHPEGLQYGGVEPSWSRRTIEALWARFMTGKIRATQIDLHTGLGEAGSGVLMTYGEHSQPRIRRARAMWDNILVSPPADGPDVLAQGVLGPHLERLFPQAEVLAVVLEYGTVAPEDVVAAIAADNWLHRLGDLESVQAGRIKQMMLDAFYSDAPGFAEKTYKRARDVVTAASNAG